ncbi:hypothetical protein O6H91_12G042600 [Diphasiastrum complanatum]|uniref:Uncharacterized protein n=1 Tax=Diphasiastrum complanatum TaxID=34168 RepID=A0ACC2C0Z5_DIPCM|nr:hypothetical protein O6H91_12G042600 [Diphasiastrum complanatum]
MAAALGSKMSSAAIGFSPPLVHPLHDLNVTATFLRVHQKFPKACQETVSVQTFTTRNVAVPQSRCRVTCLSKCKRNIVGRCFGSVGAQEETANDVFTSQHVEEKPLTILADNESIQPLTSTPSDETSSLDSGRVPSDSAEVTASLYLKSMTRRHWELITSFLNEEPNKERRLELREACTSLISTINSVRFILHNKYLLGERLEAADDNVIQKVLLHHPRREQKVGCGLEFIKIDRHPNYEARCFFVVRKDGSSVDFSFRKCILELGQQTVGLDITKRLLDFKFMDG